MNREHLRKVKIPNYGVCYFHQFISASGYVLAVLELDNGDVTTADVGIITFVS